MGAAAGLAVLGWTFWRGRRKMEITLVAGLVTGLVALVAAPAILAFFQRGESVARLETLNSRTDLWAQRGSFLCKSPSLAGG
ncbi:hypothetical protein [Fodinicola feengrottensis]|uniref:hypothetical protein n=1 Tax=Fodinicola feengrottensis TaxID=435914 RepID=UPI0013D356F6|nr:hypothetical protein [Fodinicola feengrottensis]